MSHEPLHVPATESAVDSEPSLARRTAQLIRAGIVEYEKAWAYQRQLVEERQAGGGVDTLLLVEHAPVFTLGRTAREEHWGGSVDALKQRGFAVYAIERGGSVTYHGPGQIVGYPILRLKSFCPGPKAYVDRLEAVILRVLAEWGIAARRVAQWRGVWVEAPDRSLRKIASVGVRITNGITMHGFAVNVDIDLAPFALIAPCGIEGCRVTSMTEVLGRRVPLEAVKVQIARHFGEVFGLRWIPNRSGPLPW